MSEIQNTPLQDEVTKFMFNKATIRGDIVQMQEQWQEMIQFHKYPACVCKMLGEITAGALLLASTIKFRGALVIQIKGSGPVSLVVAEVKNRTTVRAMAKIRRDAKISDDMTMQQLINENNQGQCGIILDPEDRRPSDQPYIGVVPITGDSMAAILETYMVQSEQLDTKIVLAADKEKIGGLLVQKMPDDGGKEIEDDDKDAWPRVCQLTGTLKTEELLNLSQKEILHRLFWQEDVMVVGEEKIKFYCGCSKENTDNILRSFGKEELEELLKQKGVVGVQCQFCNKTITYTPEEVEALFAENEDTKQTCCECSKEKTDDVLRSIGKKKLEEILKKNGIVGVQCKSCNKTINYTPEEVEALFADQEDNKQIH